MASFWDLLPASPWPLQPYAAPLDQMPPLNALTDQPPPLPLVQDPDPQIRPGLPSITSSPATPVGFGPLPMAIVGRPTYPNNLLGGILGTFFGAEAENASPPAPRTITPYGVVPKNLPAELRVPPPVSDWQRPESDFAIDSPGNIARIKRALSAGLRPDEIVVEGPAARVRRDNARAAEFLFPGSGNLVSGDWNNITGANVANLLLGLATAIIPPAAETRLAAAGIRAAHLPSEAETVAAAIRAANAGQRLTRSGPGGRLLTFKEQYQSLLNERNLQLLKLLDPANSKLQGPTRTGGQASVDDLRLVNKDIKAIRDHKGLLDLDRHHETTRQYGPWFELRGINPDDYVSYMWAWDHRLKGGGLHAGPYSWNYQVGDFIEGDRKAGAEKAYQQLYEMLRRRGE